MSGQPILELRNVTKQFELSGGDRLTALDAVSLKLGAGECLGIVGQSGSGKSTLAKCITHLERVTSGRIIYQGEDITDLKGEALRQNRRWIQMVFQDPFAVFNPRMTIGAFIREPLINYKVMKRREAAQESERLLELVGLPLTFAAKYAHELSGGELQRAVIARVIGIKPDIVIYDEATSALDVSIQKQILELFARLQKENGISSLFISHDLAVVQRVSGMIAVMHRGSIVETISSRHLLAEAQHPYTKALLASVLSVKDAKKQRLPAVLQAE